MRCTGLRSTTGRAQRSRSHISESDRAQGSIGHLVNFVIRMPSGLAKKRDYSSSCMSFCSSWTLWRDQGNAVVRVERAGLWDTPTNGLGQWTQNVSFPLSVVTQFPKWCLDISPDLTSLEWCFHSIPCDLQQRTPRERFLHVDVDIAGRVDNTGVNNGFQWQYEQKKQNVWMYCYDKHSIPSSPTMPEIRGTYRRRCESSSRVSPPTVKLRSVLRTGHSRFPRSHGAQWSPSWWQVQRYCDPSTHEKYPGLLFPRTPAPKI